ncbi:hypothetical protein B5M09_003482 [Aphanomyces astaci]|uniref:Aminotransferase class V domain-containing protein n=1 Tax=Aphanomyces astaci TaxID=112090 RepID=A0A3R7WVD5_APHAT|nr:hypothetical protein B5M09_003482 [Aphanomyces astaci]
MVPGPTSMTATVRQAYADDVGSPDVELDEFASDYFDLEESLKRLLSFDGSIAIGSGEGMACLWGALKSVLRPGDVVVSGANGIYGQGFADMAKGLGATVVTVESPWTTGIDPQAIIAAIHEHKPRLVTIVHCETPTGILNPLDGIGAALRDATTDGLFLVDFVSSSFAVPLNVTAELIDIGLLAPQKALSGPAALAGTTVSDRAWKRVCSTLNLLYCRNVSNIFGQILDVKYQGYDALAPFHGLTRSAPLYTPYTHNWPAIRATLQACRELEAEGLSNVIQRHAAAAAACQQLATELGLALYCQNLHWAAPTVTALHVPSHVAWDDFVQALKRERLICGGNYGDLAGKVFRIGHMGSQGKPELVRLAMASNKLVAFYREEEDWLSGNEYYGATILVGLVQRKMISNRFTYLLQWVPLPGDCLMAFDPTNTIHVNTNLINYVELHPKVDLLTLAQGREMFYSLGIQHVDPSIIVRSAISPETQHWSVEIPWEVEADALYWEHDAMHLHAQQTSNLQAPSIQLKPLQPTSNMNYPPQLPTLLPPLSSDAPTTMQLRTRDHATLFEHSAVASFLSTHPFPTSQSSDDVTASLASSGVSYPRFELLHQCLRCTKFREPSDALSALRPLVRTLQLQCATTVVPGRHVFVAVELHVVADGKPVQVVSCTSSSGVVIAFKVAVASSALVQNVVEVVHSLHHSHRIVHVHSPLISVDLVEALRTHGLYSSTCVPTRLFDPAAAPVVTASHETRPTIVWAHTRSASPNLVVATEWRGNRLSLGLLTNVDTPTTGLLLPPMVTTHLSMQKRRRRLREWCSFAAKQSTFSDDSTSWARTMLLYLMDVARVNAYLVRNHVREQEESMWVFTRALSTELIRGDWQYAPPEGRPPPPVLEEPASQLPAVLRPCVPRRSRDVFAMKRPGGKDTRCKTRQCVVCRWESTSKKKSVTEVTDYCDVHDVCLCSCVRQNYTPAAYMCPTVSWTCWEKFHQFYLPQQLFVKGARIQRRHPLYKLRHANNNTNTSNNKLVASRGADDENESDDEHWESTTRNTGMDGQAANTTKRTPTPPPSAADTSTTHISVTSTLLNVTLPPSKTRLESTI